MQIYQTSFARVKFFALARGIRKLEDVLLEQEDHPLGEIGEPGGTIPGRQGREHGPEVELVELEAGRVQLGAVLPVVLGEREAQAAALGRLHELHGVDGLDGLAHGRFHPALEIGRDLALSVEAVDLAGKRGVLLELGVGEKRRLHDLGEALRLRAPVAEARCSLEPLPEVRLLDGSRRVREVVVAAGLAPGERCCGDVHGVSPWVGGLVVRRSVFSPRLHAARRAGYTAAHRSMRPILQLGARSKSTIIYARHLAAACVADPATPCKAARP